jgi:glycyl-tRNA synthetase beta chain
VRPLQSIMCVLGGNVVPFEIAGLTSGNTTRGHRFHGNDPFLVKDFADYVKKLAIHKVIVDPAVRAASIAEQAQALAKSAKLQLVEDDALNAENAGLTEWPVVLMGTFDQEFLSVPAECLMTAMKAHQKCFSLRDAKTKKLANKFIMVSNLIATDGGAQIVSGNEKVIRARLSDAKFFWDQDRAKTLTAMSHELTGITFHEKLGTQAERVERVTELARQIAGAVDAEPELAGRAAQLCKADLVSGTVGEFPELQGLMGRYLAEDEHIDAKVSAAIEEHYKPKGAGDSVPTAPVSVAVALADKLDTLVGFWAINEKPTGSGDPYQLRRAALGVIRIVLENDLRVPIEVVSMRAALRYVYQSKHNPLSVLHIPQTKEALDRLAANLGSIQTNVEIRETFRKIAWLGSIVDEDNGILRFFADRLKVYLKDKGARHDLIDAVFALGGQDDLALIVKRVEALDAFLKTDDGANLLAGVKRASNILAIEEKKDKTSHTGEPNGAHLVEPAERDLDAAIAKVKFDTKAAIDVENFAGAMRALSELRKPVDTFFEKVTVNDADPKLRLNRLKLLSEIRAATTAVADFSKIAG